MSGLYPGTESRRAAKIDVAAQTCAHLSDVAIACGKRSSNGPDQNTPSRTRDENEGLENLSSKIYECGVSKREFTAINSREFANNEFEFISNCRQINPNHPSCKVKT